MVTMNFYDDLVMQTQMNYSKYYHIYASGSTPYQLTDQKPLPVAEIFTTRTTTPTGNTSGLLLRSTTSKVLLQG